MRSPAAIAVAVIPAGRDTATGVVWIDVVVPLPRLAVSAMAPGVEGAVRADGVAGLVSGGDRGGGDRQGDGDRGLQVATPHRSCRRRPGLLGFRSQA